MTKILGRLPCALWKALEVFQGSIQSRDFHLKCKIREDSLDASYGVHTVLFSAGLFVETLAIEKFTS